MKSNAFGIGSINLKGRKTKRLGCGCCVATNYKEKDLKTVHLKEIKESMERLSRPSATLKNKKDELKNA